MMWQSCLFVIAMIVPVEPGHFGGGSIRWTPVNTSATGSPIEIAISQSYSYTLSQITCNVGSTLVSGGIERNYNLSCTLNCGATSAGYAPPPVVGNCVGFNKALDVAFSQRTDVVSLVTGDYFSATFGILNTATSGYYRTLTTPNGTTIGSAHWNITTVIDVRFRSDNGRINTPPVANLLSPRGIPLNTPTQIVIPTFDVDNDNVRCRWGNSSLECGGVCFPTTLPLTTSLSSDCVLNITATSLSTWYAGSLQAEDFYTSSSNTPLSSIPVQFLIYVYTPKNCSIPNLTGPSTCADLQVAVPYTFTLTATYNCGLTSNISDILVQSFTGVVQGPLVTVTPHFVYTRDITFTPSIIQLGPQILCAIALDDTSVPSDQYCITFIVSATATSVCPSVSSNSTVTAAQSSSSINWAFIAVGISLGVLFSLSLALCWCYHFFWSAKGRLRRQKLRQKQKEGVYEMMDNQASSSMNPSEFQIDQTDESGTVTAPSLSSNSPTAVQQSPSHANRIESSIKPSHVPESQHLSPKARRRKHSRRSVKVVPASSIQAQPTTTAHITHVPS